MAGTPRARAAGRSGGTDTGGGPVPDLVEQPCRSFGGGWEHGFVQRRSGAEPPACLPVARTPLGKDLIRALATDRTAGDPCVDATETRASWRRSRHRDIGSNAGASVGRTPSGAHPGSRS